MNSLTRRSFLEKISALAAGNPHAATTIVEQAIRYLS